MGAARVGKQPNAAQSLKQFQRIRRAGGFPYALQSRGRPARGSWDRGGCSWHRGGCSDGLPAPLGLAGGICSRALSYYDFFSYHCCALLLVFKRQSRCFYLERKSILGLGLVVPRRPQRTAWQTRTHAPGTAGRPPPSALAAASGELGWVEAGSIFPLGNPPCCWRWGWCLTEGS